MQSIETRPIKAPLHLYTRPNIAECPAPSLLSPPSLRCLVDLSCLVFPRLNIKKKPTTGPRLVVLVHRPEEALPVAAVLVVRGGWTERGTPLHPATGGAPTEGVLAEERLASRDDRRLDTGFLRGR